VQEKTGWKAGEMLENAGKSGKKFRTKEAEKNGSEAGVNEACGNQ